MPQIPDSLRYLIEALRSGPGPNSAQTTIQSGPRAGTSIDNPRAGFGPIEQRRDGYRLYVKEAAVNGEQPMSYEEWFSRQEPMSSISGEQ